MDAFNWTCPYCGKPQVATAENSQTHDQILTVSKSQYGWIGVRIKAVACLSADCRQLSLETSLRTVTSSQYVAPHLKDKIFRWDLLPESTAVSQPEYIPDVIRTDYYEACRIKNLSPKASATLSRRCLQGMIRDFCGIAKATLNAEIQELRKAVAESKAPSGVTHESVEAIDHVRSVGNIGAHMEKDINLIVDVDAEEAQALIDLIELLFKEWYVARHDRQTRLARLAVIAAEKKALIADGKSADSESRS